VFPKAQWFNPQILQLDIIVQIPFNVASDFGIPELLVGFGCLVAFGALVPKAAVNEYGHLLRSEVYIRFAWQAGMEPVAPQAL